MNDTNLLTGVRRGGLDHSALLYSSMNGFLDYMVPYISEGLNRNEPVFAALGREEVAALRDEMGANDRLLLEDTREWAPHPATRLRAFYEHILDQLGRGAAGIRLAGEPVWPSGRPEFVLEWKRYESVLNEALEPFPVTLVCTYPTHRLTRSIAESARRTHPFVAGNGSRGPSPEFRPPSELLRDWSPELSPPPEGAFELPIAVDPQEGRRLLRERAIQLGARPDRVEDMCLAGDEVLTNALIHGGGVARALIWAEGDHLICQVEDLGPGVRDPLTGYHPPDLISVGGRGVWLARQVADLLQIAPGTQGTVVRLHVRLA